MTNDELLSSLESISKLDVLTDQQEQAITVAMMIVERKTRTKHELLELVRTSAAQLTHIIARL